jgi:hypothetical protein
VDPVLDHALAWNGAAANADALAIAPYFNADAAGLVENVDATLKLSSDQVIDQMLASIRGNVKTSIDQHAELAKKYNLTLMAYESGPGDSTWYFPADRIDAMTALFAAPTATRGCATSTSSTTGSGSPAVATR